MGGVTRLVGREGILGEKRGMNWIGECTFSLGGEGG